ncbi:hypothetical protein JCGZ_10957 [Jatropha curcas]|uniref:Phorbol-ester/DAG-type domain-containing protein n=1 Tax=Jatropha curcas TaxID=180498 RepID=A0A067LH25_JATCU|nr:hypothetical protein JCGZ_10957 [Jatropha curcas]
MVYNCSLCQFDLDIDCALKPCVSGTPTGNYEHQFFHLLKSINFTCDACGNEGTQSPYICIMCQIMVHKECISRPKAIRITEHKHVITHFYFLQNSESTDQSCGICQIEMNLDHGGYYCSLCDYVVHVDCARKHLIGVEDETHKLGTDALGDLSIKSTSDDDADEQLVAENKQFSHEHGLAIIDQECSELSTKIKHPLHRHSLTLLLKAYSFDGLFKCNACEQYCHGFCYHCEKCDFYLDIRCYAIISTLKHHGHDHLLRLVLSKRSYMLRTNSVTVAKPVRYDMARLASEPSGRALGAPHKRSAARDSMPVTYSCHCSACYETKFSYFECEDCNFCLDFKCATLPISVRHRFDEKHPLKLTYDFVSDRSFDHYCEVCEMRIDPGTYVFNYAPWFYGCEECDISIHPECVLGRYPYIKFDRSSAYSLSGIHSHGLTLVQKPFILVKKRKFYPPCDHCAEPFDEDLALQCSQCNFIIHRKGPCFTQNVQQ